MWVEPVATTKFLGYLHSPQREFYAEGLLGRHALGMLGRTLHGVLLLHTRPKGRIQGERTPLFGRFIGLTGSLLLPAAVFYTQR